MAVNIDWGLATTPNVLGAYMGARQKAEQNALAREQMTYERQRQETQDARDGERWSVEKSGLEALAQDRSRKAQMDRVTTSYRAARAITSPEQLEASRASLARIDPDFATATWDDIQQLHTVGRALAGRELVKGSDGSYSSIDAETHERLGGYTPPRDPKFEQFDPNKDTYEIPGRPAQVEGALAPASGGALWGRLIRQESGGNQEAVSPKGAFGRAQLMPATAQQIAQEMGDPSLADRARTDPAVNERLGQYYLNQQLQRFGSEAAALAAYNAGPSKAQEWIERFGDPREIGVSAWVQQIPYGETRNYVASILGGAQPYEVASNGETPPPPAGGAGPRLVQRAQPKPQVQRLTPQEVKAAGLAPGTVAQRKPDGSIDVIQKPADASGGKPTEADKKATGFAYRTLRANDRLNSLADRKIYKPGTATAQLFDTNKNGVVRTVTKNEQDRLFLQAAKEWLAPILRKDTGAAVTDGELATYMDIYIPRFEDSPEVMKRKAEARQDAMIALTREAGPLFGRTYGNRQFVSKYPGSGKRSRQEPRTSGAGWRIVP